MAATAAIVLSVPLYLAVRSLRPPRTAPLAEAQHVGSEKCKACHEKAYAGWKGSNHARAMQAAKDGLVHGDFGGATLEHRGRTWRFFRQGEKFMAHAEGPDGADARLRGGLHLRRRAAPAVPGGLSRGPAAVALGRLGHEGEALVLRRPPGRRSARRLAPLDASRPELERHVLGLPLHGGAQAL